MMAAVLTPVLRCADHAEGSGGASAARVTAGGDGQSLARLNAVWLHASEMPVTD